MKETSINSSIYYIPLIQGWVRRVKRSIRENPDNPLPSDPLQLLLGDPQALRSIRIYNPSSKFWVCPEVSSKLDTENLQMEATRWHYIIKCLNYLSCEGAVALLHIPTTYVSSSPHL